MGTVALLAAAESLSAKPPARSVILLACTAEEIGLVGSEYYVNHPVFPLEKTVFNLNNDGAGYNSTAHFTVIGLEMTNVDGELEKAGEAFGLALTGDPAPAQNLYSRSDNVNFAKAGIPAIDIAPGITQMDETVFKYYHQASDNPENIDYDYLHVFCQTFARMARLIADKNESIEWMEGKAYGRAE
jgi:Zn-dependent M28 family amino/carboxypeptidase